MSVFDALGGLGADFAASQQARQQQNLSYFNDLLNQSLYPNLGSFYGVRTINNPVKDSKVKCRYCGNLYLKEVAMQHNNCPICAGGWAE